MNFFWVVHSPLNIPPLDYRLVTGHAFNMAIPSHTTESVGKNMCHSIKLTCLYEST